MAEGGEKTEKASARKREEARKEGNVFHSRDVVTVAVLLGVFYVMRISLPTVYPELTGYFKSVLSMAAEAQEALSFQLYIRFMKLAARIALPMLLSAALLGALGHLVQTRMNVRFRLLRPRGSRMNPLQGLGRIFSRKNLMELLKNLVKILLLLLFLYRQIQGDILRISRMMDMNLTASGAILMDLIFRLILQISAAFSVIAFFDYLYQRWEYERNLRMTKQEVKDEYRQTEGNPEIRGRLRNIRRQRANRRMMQQVPKADVIIRNPTHLAIAIQYEPERHGAPVVLAKGQDEIALRIVQTAEKSRIPGIENRELARALYPKCRIGKEIPPEFYGAVAEILVYIYRQQNREELLC